MAAAVRQVASVEDRDERSRREQRGPRFGSGWCDESASAPADLLDCERRRESVRDPSVELFEWAW